MKRNMNIRLGFSFASALLIATMFASCTRVELEDPSSIYGDEIRFASSSIKDVSKPLTKSMITDNGSLLKDFDEMLSITSFVEDGMPSDKLHSVATKGTQADIVTKFDVAAYYFASNEENNDAGGSFMFGATVSDGVNTDGTSYHWPNSGMINFIAVPYINGEKWIEPSNIGGEFGNISSIAYAVTSKTENIAEDIAAQKDIMVAVSGKVNNNTSGNPVPLKFQHLLAAVQFKVGEMTACKVTSINITGVYGGTVTYSYDSATKLWTASDLSSKVSYVPGLGDTSNMDMGTIINGGEQVLLVAPQTTPEGAKLTVMWEDLIGGTTGSVTVDFAGQEWAMGKTTSYLLNIKPTFSITIPRPVDQDAHYVMVPMYYNLGNISNNVTDVTASVEYVNNTASSTVIPSLKLGVAGGDSVTPLTECTGLTELQRNGYWTEYQYTAVDNEDGTVSYTKPVYIRGTNTEDSNTDNDVLSLTDASGNIIKSGTIVLFLPENNGTTDRDVVLRIKGKYEGKEIMIGSGSFVQYCPSWSDDGTIGVERIEEDTTHPWGFKWTRKAEYRFFSFLNIFLPSIFENQFDYEGSYYKIEKFSFITMRYWSVVIDYTSLNQITGANSQDGLSNTMDLFNHTGTEGGVSEIEEFCINYTSLIGDKFVLESEEGENNVPDDFAAYEALKRNKFSEVLRGSSNSNETYIFPTIFEEDMQWFLPSINDATKLFENGCYSDGISSEIVDQLEGTYWSSNRDASSSEDSDLKAQVFKFTSNIFDASNNPESVDRMALHKIRAVRKKN